VRYAAALTALCLVATAGCNPPPRKAATAPSASGPPSGAAATPVVLKITGQGTSDRPVHVVQQVHNRVDYDLVASSYESQGSQGRMRSVFQNARVKFRDKRGATIDASAPQAVVDESANTVTLFDGVHARTSSGITLECSQLVYERATGMLHGSGNVIVTDPKGFRATGSSFDSDVSLTHMRMR
jgi:hypothetical protein